MECEQKDGGSPITGYVVEYHVASDPASSFETQVVRHDVFSTTLNGLTPSTEYEVRVRGENAVGHSVSSVTKRTMTDGEANYFQGATFQGVMELFKLWEKVLVLMCFINCSCQQAILI